MKYNAHFTGIGGAGASVLARLAMDLGYSVSGSDIKKSPLTDSLQREGTAFYEGHSPENIPENTRFLVYSSAVPVDNPELVRAKERNIPIMERAEFLGKVFSLFEKPIAVSGTHGKSTATAMVSAILSAADFSPTCLIGADTADSDFGYIKGSRDYLVAEACEYRDGFLNLSPFCGMILNIEYEHPDYFRSIESEAYSFRLFAGKIRPLGFLVINRQTDVNFRISENALCETRFFDISPENPNHLFYPLNLREEKGFYSFGFMFEDRFLGRIRLSVPGLHNVKNALAAGGAAYLLGVAPQVICRALSSFSGVKRRLEHKGTFSGADIYDDYAHHPTEISASLTAIKKMTGKHVICLFQPHTYSRTYALFDEFLQALSMADEVLLAPIYAAREKYTESVNSENLSDSLRAMGKSAANFGNFYEIEKYLKKNLTPGDVLVIMGAGDIDRVLNSLK